MASSRNPDQLSQINQAVAIATNLDTSDELFKSYLDSFFNRKQNDTFCHLTQDEAHQICLALLRNNNVNRVKMFREKLSGNVFFLESNIQNERRNGVATKRQNQLDKFLFDTVLQQKIDQNIVTLFEIYKKIKPISLDYIAENYPHLLLKFKNGEFYAEKALTALNNMKHIPVEKIRTTKSYLTRAVVKNKLLNALGSYPDSYPVGNAEYNKITGTVSELMECDTINDFKQFILQSNKDTRKKLIGSILNDNILRSSLNIPIVQKEQQVLDALRLETKEDRPETGNEYLFMRLMDQDISFDEFQSVLSKCSDLFLEKKIYFTQRDHQAASGYEGVETTIDANERMEEKIVVFLSSNELCQVFLFLERNKFDDKLNSLKRFIDSHYSDVSEESFMNSLCKTFLAEMKTDASREENNEKINTLIHMIESYRAKHIVVNGYQKRHYTLDDEVLKKIAEFSPDNLLRIAKSDQIPVEALKIALEKMYGDNLSDKAVQNEIHVRYVKILLEGIAASYESYCKDPIRGIGHKGYEKKVTKLRDSIKTINTIEDVRKAVMDNLNLEGSFGDHSLNTYLLNRILSGGWFYRSLGLGSYIDENINPKNERARKNIATLLMSELTKPRRAEIEIKKELPPIPEKEVPAPEVTIHTVAPDLQPAEAVEIPAPVRASVSTVKTVSAIPTPSMLTLAERDFLKHAATVPAVQAMLDVFQKGELKLTEKQTLEGVLTFVKTAPVEIIPNEILTQAEKLRENTVAVRGANQKVKAEVEMKVKNENLNIPPAPLTRAQTLSVLSSETTSLDQFRTTLTNAYTEKEVLVGERDELYSERENYTGYGDGPTGKKIPIYETRSYYLLSPDDQKELYLTLVKLSQGTNEELNDNLKLKLQALDGYIGSNLQSVHEFVCRETLKEMKDNIPALRDIKIANLIEIIPQNSRDNFAPDVYQNLAELSPQNLLKFSQRPPLIAITTAIEKLDNDPKAQDPLIALRDRVHVGQTPSIPIASPLTEVELFLKALNGKIRAQWLYEQDNAEEQKSSHFTKLNNIADKVSHSIFRLQIQGTPVAQILDILKNTNLDANVKLAQINKIVDDRLRVSGQISEPERALFQEIKAFYDQMISYDLPPPSYDQAMAESSVVSERQLPSNPDAVPIVEPSAPVMVEPSAPIMSEAESEKNLARIAELRKLVIQQQEEEQKRQQQVDSVVDTAAPTPAAIPTPSAPPAPPITVKNPAGDKSVHPRTMFANQTQRDLSILNNMPAPPSHAVIKEENKPTVAAPQKKIVKNSNS